MLVTCLATAFDDRGKVRCASLWCHVTQRQRSGQLDLICYMNDDIGLINVNVISLFYESGNYRGLCWPGPVLFIVLGLDTAVWPHQ